MKAREMKNTTDRELIFEEDIQSPYLRCIHCERTYTRGEYRIVKIHGHTLEMCPYQDCDGDTVVDAWSWDKIREYIPFYPEIPFKNVIYPLYPKPKAEHLEGHIWCSVCRRTDVKNNIKMKKNTTICGYKDCPSNKKSEDRPMCHHYPWELVREYFPDYPKTPENGVIYKAE